LSSSQSSDQDEKFFEKKSSEDFPSLTSFTQKKDGKTVSNVKKNFQEEEEKAVQKKNFGASLFQFDFLDSDKDDDFAEKCPQQPEFQENLKKIFEMQQLKSKNEGLN